MAIITISRGTFSGGRRLASCLASSLGFALLSREVLAAAASAYGIDEERLARGLQEPPSFWDRFRVDRQAYLSAVTATACRMVRDDNVVYHGHAGHLLLPPLAHLLRVRVIAPMRLRVPEAMASHGLEPHEAEAFIEARDRERAEWTRFLYSVEWDDPGLYDMVVNLETLTLETACRVIASVAGLPGLRATPAESRRLDDRWLTHHVRATLFLDPRIGPAAARLEIASESGLVEVRGAVGGGQERDIRSALTQIPEISHVRVVPLVAR